MPVTPATKAICPRNISTSTSLAFVEKKLYITPLILKSVLSATDIAVILYDLKMYLYWLIRN